MRKILFFLAVVLFIFGGTLIYVNNLAGSGISFGAGVLLLVFVFLQSFSKFEGFGIKAELLDQKISEADEILKKLRKMSLSTGEMLFSICSRMGRWNSTLPLKEQFRMIENIEKTMEDIGISEQEIDKAKGDLHLFYKFDMANPIREYLIGLLREKEKAVNEIIAVYKQPIDNSDEQWNGLIEKQRNIQNEIRNFNNLFIIGKSLSLENITKAITTSEQLSDEEKDKTLKDNDRYLKDINYYDKYHRIRDRDYWIENDEKTRRLEY